MRASILSIAPLLALALVGCDKKEAAGTPVADAAFEMTSPEAAAWTTAGSADVTGTAENVESVSVLLAPDGTAAEATRTGKDWKAKATLVRGINVVEAQALDLHGDTQFRRHGVLAGDFGNPDDGVNDALAVRVNQSGLDKVGDMVADYMTPELVTTSATAMNPVYTDSYGLWGWDAVTISADIDSVSFDRPQIQFEPTPGVLNLTATLPNLFVDAQAYGDVVGIDFDSDVTMSASSAVLTASVAVDIVDGDISVTLTDCSVVFNDFAYDTSLLPGDIEAYILVDTIRSTVEEMLVTKINEMVPELLSSTLAGLDPSFSTDILGHTVDMAFGFADATIDRDGIALDLDVDVGMDYTGSRTYAGYLSAPKVSPTVDTHADIAAGFSDNVLNMVLFQAWRAGVLDMSLSTYDGSLDAAMLILLKADEGTISTSASLPPVLVESAAGLPQIQMSEMLVTIDTPGGDLGDHIVVAMSLWIEVEMVIEGGELVLSLGEPTIVMDVRESDWGASNESTTNLLSDALPIDVILTLLGDISFPLPSLYGITVESGAADRDASGYYTDATVYLQ